MGRNLSFAAFCLLVAVLVAVVLVGCGALRAPEDATPTAGRPAEGQASATASEGQPATPTLTAALATSIVPAAPVVTTVAPAPTQPDTSMVSPLPTPSPVPDTTNLSPLPTGSPAPPPTVECVGYGPLPHYSYEVVSIYPHDPAAFTEGLLFLDGWLYESTGRKGQSSVRRVDLETGSVEQAFALPEQFFGEGLTLVEDRLIQLTWRSKVGFVYDRDSLRPLAEFSYPTEGWGITFDGDRLIMSDGSSTLYFWDSQSLEEVGRVLVQADRCPVNRLNELEYVEGEVYANVWLTDTIARIDPQDGHVTGWIDLHGLLDRESLNQPADVLNGLAYDDENDRLFVTGKLWPSLFEIRLVPAD